MGRWRKKSLQKEPMATGCFLLKNNEEMNGQRAGMVRNSWQEVEKGR